MKVPSFKRETKGEWRGVNFKIKCCSCRVPHNHFAESIQKFEDMLRAEGWEPVFGTENWRCPGCVQTVIG